MSQFQSTHSLRSATNNTGARGNELEVSIHALLTECDPSASLSRFVLARFNPRTPYGVRPRRAETMTSTTAFQSTHSLRSATEKSGNHDIDYGVSIHALLTECDLNLTETRQKAAFQSTHSLRSATAVSTYENALDEVSIHALLTECDGGQQLNRTKVPVSIHALLTECDMGTACLMCRKMLFQSTHSLRSATRRHSGPHAGKTVSIHALLTECDFAAAFLLSFSPGFNPRTPYGVRRRY